MTLTHLKKFRVRQQATPPGIGRPRVACQQTDLAWGIRMKRTRTAALFAVVSSAVAIVMAVPAHADDQIDPMFLQAVHDKGILMPNSTAIKLAHGTCSAMRSGGVNSALSYLKKNAGNLSNDDAVKFGGLAIYAYCRDLTPK